MSRRHKPGVAADSSRAAQAVAVGYVRRSTDRQEQSIPDQKRAIELYAAQHGFRIERFYEDDAISGSSIVGRRAFQQMLADAQDRHRTWNSIIVYDVKRFGRVDNDEAGYYRHILKTHGVEVHYTSEGFSGSETDDLLRPVKQWQARQESKDLAKVTIRGLLSKAMIGGARLGGDSRDNDRSSAGGRRRRASHTRDQLSVGGAWMGGVPPVGYDLGYENDRGEFLFVLRYLRDGRKQMLDKRQRPVRTLARDESVNTTKRDRAKLVPGEASRIEVVREIFRMYTVEGRGLKAISDALNSRGVPTPRGPEWSPRCAGLWRDSSVRAILVNPIYAGDMVWNRRTDARFFSIKGGVAVERKTPHGARLVPNAPEDWIITRDTHEALIDRRTFELAQRVREDRPASEAQRGTSKTLVGGWTGARARFLLSGLIRCEACGCKFQGVTRTKGRRRKDGSQVRNFYYACGGYIAKGRSVCAYRPLPQGEMESAVCRAVVAYYQRYAGESGRSRLATGIAKRLGIEASDLQEARRRVLADQGRTEASITKLLDNLTPGNRDLAEERLGQLRSQRDAARVRLEELDRLAQSQGKVAELSSEVSRFVAGLEFILEHGLNEEKRVAIRRAVNAIHLHGDRAEIALRVLPLQGVDVETDLVRIKVVYAGAVHTAQMPAK